MSKYKEDVERLELSLAEDKEYLSKQKLGSNEYTFAEKIIKVREMLLEDAYDRLAVDTELTIKKIGLQIQEELLNSLHK